MTLTMSPEPALLAIDWGTTSFRAALLGADGTALDRRTAAAGIMQVPDHNFAAVVEERIGGWIERHPALPIYASGMIGSRNGWIEVPYAACPASLEDLAGAVVRHEAGGFAIHFVPGLSHTDAHGTPEVMRGEEVQIFGAVEPEEECLVVLPGTHSKWAMVRRGRIAAFATFMTGELYAVLRSHTILGQLIQGEAEDSDAFASGVRRGFHEPFLSHALFGARTLPLFGRLAATSIAAYLSGLLIGAELAGGMRLLGDLPATRRVIGNRGLATRYAKAAAVVDLALAIGPDDAAFSGCLALARIRGDVAP